MIDHLLSEALARIEARRAALGMSFDRLCAAAGITLPTYYRWRKGRSAPTRPALQRLDSALDRAERGVSADPTDRLLEVFCGGLREAARLHLPAERLRDRALLDNVVMTLTATYSGQRPARVARHLCVTRPAITYASRRIDALREEDRAFDAAMRALIRAAFQEED